MKKLSWMIVILLAMSMNVFADDELNTGNSGNVQQGATQYDWQTCIYNKASDCQTACSQSEDLHCMDDCRSMAADKCTAEGVQKPS